MKKTEFERNMRGAKRIAMLSSAEPPDQAFWAGYQRGMRRHYYGKKFGTTAKKQTHDKQRRYRSLGYRAGFDGMPISETIKTPLFRRRPYAEVNK